VDRDTWWLGPLIGWAEIAVFGALALWVIRRFNKAADRYAELQKSAQDEK
jgi:hypothetical protein